MQRWYGSNLSLGFMCSFVCEVDIFPWVRHLHKYFSDYILSLVYKSSGLPDETSMADSGCLVGEHIWFILCMAVLLVPFYVGWSSSILCLMFGSIRSNLISVWVHIKVQFYHLWAFFKFPHSCHSLQNHSLACIIAW